MLVYLDSCVVIYALEQAATLGAPVLKALNELPASAKACVSDMVRMECMVQPTRVNDQERIQRIREFLALFAHRPISSADFELATDFRAKSGLRVPDALHLATAINAGCTQFWTNDDRLSKSTDKIQFRKFNRT